MGERRPRVLLIVEDSSAHRADLRRAFESTEEFDEIVEAADGMAGLRVLYSHDVHAVICDLELPGFDGEKLLAAKQQRPEIAEAPILFVSANRNPERKVRLLERGASDTIEKPFHAAELVARLGVHLRLRRLQEELREKNEVLERLSTTDALTSLRNRRSVDQMLANEFERSRRYGNALSVLMADIDHFKRVNDRHGHPIGDTALRHVAERLAAEIRKTDVAARYGGEEFLIVLPETALEGAALLGERVRKAVEHAALVLPAGDRLDLTISMGAAQKDSEDAAPADLVAAADRALYDAKAGGRNRLVSASR
jgi:two-component system cell cycle response regulator